jgi:hypothetical protein
MTAQHSIYVGAYRRVRRQRPARSLPVVGFARDPHLVSGWWILPATAAGLAIWIGFFALIL